MTRFGTLSVRSSGPRKASPVGDVVLARSGSAAVSATDQGYRNVAPERAHRALPRRRMRSSAPPIAATTLTSLSSP